MNALFISGSPRKGWNTEQLLESAMKGATDAGAQTELVRLYGVEPFKGCVSCFACKVKGAKTNGLCALRDHLMPVLEKALMADVIVIGSPIYFSHPTALTFAFMERMMFPLSAYKYDKDGHAGASLVHRVVPTAMIYTMNLPEQWMEEVQYPTILGTSEQFLRTTYGYSETLYSCDTVQFSDYDKYDIETFNKEAKLKHHDEQFPIDLQKAHDLGARLVRIAKESAGVER